ncbi:hypothetical protein GCM10023115_01090 [Pontixanthobacter gangjinensis]|uniref:Lipoprotein n=1 Tax=Pontixanthobacter gangjinensis TaxID=1028742 RepID=A0A6I4SIF3_9SPHN|nr:hypothetical protein [Pontixanthobacter gangjinensis]MXO55365.1 hypothetical protein [Pontixanthobacter gangjinensis]
MKLGITTLASVVLLSACVTNETPADPEPAEISWTEAVEYINSGGVETAMQTHSLFVYLQMKDGREFTTTEPNIDEVFRVIRNCGEPCADIARITE